MGKSTVKVYHSTNSTISPHPVSSLTVDQYDGILARRFGGPCERYDIGNPCLTNDIARALFSGNALANSVYKLNFSDNWPTGLLPTSIGIAQSVGEATYLALHANFFLRNPWNQFSNGIFCRGAAIRKGSELVGAVVAAFPITGDQQGEAPIDILSELLAEQLRGPDRIRELVQLKKEAPAKQTLGLTGMLQIFSRMQGPTHDQSPDRDRLPTVSEVVQILQEMRNQGLGSTLKMDSLLHLCQLTLEAYPNSEMPPSAQFLQALQWIQEQNPSAIPQTGQTLQKLQMLQGADPGRVPPVEQILLIFQMLGEQSPDLVQQVYQILNSATTPNDQISSILQLAQNHMVFQIPPQPRSTPQPPSPQAQQLDLLIQMVQQNPNSPQVRQMARFVQMAQQNPGGQQAQFVRMVQENPAGCNVY
jgi:hypothetical protein